jgi:hypothetical protein
MNPTFTTLVAYAIDFLSAFASAQFADSKLTHANTSLLNSARTRVRTPTHLTDFPKNNGRKQGEHNETKMRFEELSPEDSFTSDKCQDDLHLIVQF